MNDAFFKTAARAPAFGFGGGPLDRVSERRDDAASVAALRARPDAKAVLIARDMPILPRGEPPLAPFFPLAEVERLGGARFEALLGIEAAGAPVFAALLPDGAVEQVADDSDGFLDRRQLVVPGRDDLALDRSALDRRAGAGRRGSARRARPGQGDPLLACAPRLLRQLRRSDPARRRRLAARVRRLQGAAFSPHRSGRHHAGARRRALPARPPVALAEGHVFVPRRLSSNRARRSRRRSGAKSARRRGSPAARSPISPRSRGPSRRR